MYLEGKNFFSDVVSLSSVRPGYLLIFLCFIILKKVKGDEGIGGGNIGCRGCTFYD